MQTRFPKDFTPDLRRLKSWPSMKDSLWRQPYLIELTYARNFRLVKETLSNNCLNILEVGCGTGFMSLELARMGHDVTAIDSNETTLRIAKRTLKTDPYPRNRGHVVYKNADFNAWIGKPYTFDLVLFSRALHDMHQPRVILSKTHDLLKDGGKIICLEYAYDQMDKRVATWLYMTRRFLDIAGWYDGRSLPEDPRSGIQQIIHENLNRKQHINSYRDMWRPLRHLFRQQSLSWHSYHCWDVFRYMRLPHPVIERKFATLLRKEEDYLIESGQIKPVLFRFVGTKN